MRIDPVQLKDQNRLIQDYRKYNNRIASYFDYSPFHDYEQRLSDLKEGSFNRTDLVDVLHTANEKWNAPQATHRNIDRLLDEDSVVVIGGQQAGVMTGPFYTINKIISIIQFAKQQEEKLNIPVVPVFWIAGEDHDYDEINHIYLLEKSQMKKQTLMQKVIDKYSISTIAIDQKDAQNWLNDLFKQLNETEYTRDLYAITKDCLEQSATYVDFFAKIIFQLFKEEGLVLIDSGDPEVRKLESDHFVHLIKNQTEISNKVHLTLQELRQAGYSIPLETEIDDAHLFYHLENERILLKRSKNNTWIGKQNEIELTTEELINIAIEKPELLSNNVVTRPLMQELIFPTLAFVAGNGEIAYWAALKGAFHALEMKMPPVLPRLSFSYIDRRLERVLQEFSIEPQSVLSQGIAERKGNWLASQSTPPIDLISEQLKKSITEAHRPLRSIAEEMQDGLSDLAAKNLTHLHREVDFLADRMLKKIENEYKLELERFDFVQEMLQPFGGLQERIWNPLPFINQYGLEFINELVNESCCFEEPHFFVYIK